jgi:hypothetical protein
MQDRCERRGDRLYRADSAVVCIEMQYSIMCVISGVT